MYINYILFLSKDFLKKHIEHLITIFGRLRAAGLKVNAHKCSFGLKDITYLSFVITREGVEPDPKKVHGIIDLGRPTTTIKVRALTGMIQYYRDRWPMLSHVSAPLTEAASYPKDRK